MFSNLTFNCYKGSKNNLFDKKKHSTFYLDDLDNLIKVNVTVFTDFMNNVQ